MNTKIKMSRNKKKCHIKCNEKRNKTMDEDRDRLLDVANKAKDIIQLKFPDLDVKLFSCYENELLEYYITINNEEFFKKREFFDFLFTFKDTEFDNPRIHIISNESYFVENHIDINIKEKESVK